MFSPATPYGLPAPVWLSFRARTGDVSLTCPKCGTGKLLVHGHRMWFFCFGGQCNLHGEKKDLEELFNAK
jgi:hypothetical protein